MTHNWVPKLEGAEGPLYRRIADAVETDICSGILPPRTMLPPQRELADVLGVGLGTVTKAYKEAEKKGLIRGDRRRGTVVVPFSEHDSLFSRLVSMIGKKEDINLLPHGTRPLDLGNVLGKLAKASGVNNLLRYPSLPAKASHRQAGVAWLARLGLNADPDEVLLSVGAHSGIVGALASITMPGDYIVTESVTYMGISAIAEFLNLRVLPAEIDEEGILPDAFESWCARRPVKALFCVPTIHNPTNVNMSLQRRREIIAVAEHHGIPIIEDDVLGPMLPDPILPMKSLAPHRCFMVTSASKILCPGIKVGFVVPPTGSLKITMDSLQAMTVRVPPLLAEVFTYIIRGADAQRTIDMARKEAHSRQELAARVLPDDLARCHPASYYVWIRLPRYWTAPAFTKAALRRGIRVWPADMFAPEPSVTPRAVRYLIGPVPNKARLKEELRILTKLICRKRGSE